MVWGDLGTVEFTDPFFDDTIARWTAGKPRATVHTNLDTLVELDRAPTLEPSGLIFHLSRCGSTLITRLLRQVPGTVVVSEPDIVNRLLIADEALIDEAARVRLLRLIIRALGRQRRGNERHFVIKLSSWSVRRFDWLRRAFPAAPVIWVQRRPAEILTSLLAKRPGWRYWKDEPAIAAAIFGIPVAQVAALDDAAFYAGALAAMLEAAAAIEPGAVSTIDYAELPMAAWTMAAPRFGLCPDVADIARMQVEAQYYSKDSKPRMFEPSAPAKVSDAVRRLATERLDALYELLSRSQASKARLPRLAASQS
ncbi:MAG: hypothetical protein WB760_14660 [Xanthobacteraceae bacterium]